MSPFTRIVLIGALSLLAASMIVIAEEGVRVEPGRVPLSVADFGPYDAQLVSLIELALSENPRIRSAWSGVDAGFQRAPQARSLPDPQLQYRYFAETPETRVGPQKHALEISQGLPWKGKRGLQAERAERLAAATGWQARDLERAVVADLKRAYFEAAYLQEAIILNSEERELLRRFESIALKRYSTGVGIQQSVVKVQTDITRLDDQESALRERLRSVSRRLAELIDRPAATLALDPIRLEIFDGSLGLDTLEQSSVVAHPRIRAVESRIEADDAWSRRAALESRPDFRLGIGYTFVGNRDDASGVAMPPEDNGQNILALTAGINIPLYRNRIRAGVAEAESSRRSSAEFLEAERNRLSYGVQESVLRVESLTERSELYREVLIPQAQESLASAEAAYATNKLRFLDLLDAERVLFRVRLTYQRMLSDYWGAVSDLERALGRAVPGTGAQTATGSQS